jgi:large subunit ribosomal protein L1
MDNQEVKKALDELHKQPKRKFSQSYDLIINLKHIVVKTNPVDISVSLHYPRGRQIKVAAFVDQQLAEEAKRTCHFVIKDTEFAKYQDKKALKKLADSYDYFISQANLMPKVAATFGKVLGIKGKMPNPKMGCVVPPNANLEPLVKRLSNTVRVSAKKATNLQCTVAKEGQPEEEIIDNVLTVYQTVLKQLPNEIQNIKNVYLKLSMSKPVKI